MPIRLEDALKHASLLPADPVIRAGASTAASTQLRWIHSSEVLDIAPLLGGGELLLTGGQALALATDKRRTDYIWELAERGVAALAVETGTELATMPSSMVSAAEAAGLPLIELRKVVPFVGVMEAINSLLVSESAAQLQQADRASHAMAVELAHGGSLDRILALLADATGAEVVLTSNLGAALASALPAGQTSMPEAARSEDEARQDRARTIHIDVSVRGIPSARLTLRALVGADLNLARIAGNRSVDILALALLQRMPPGLKEMAGAALMRAVDSGTQNWRLQQLAPAAGIPLAAQLVAIVVRSPGSRQLRTAVERLLDRVGRHSASYADNDELLALAVLRAGLSEEDRKDIVAGLQSLDLPEGSVSAVGPVASGIAAAPWSLTEARLTLDLAADADVRRASGQSGAVLDAEAFAVERLAFHSLDEGLRTDFVRQQLGAILDHDAQRRSLLVETLRVWLDSGCNTAQAARELHLERQSMHQRLQRIFSLCGGDPRGTGRLAALHLATKLALPLRAEASGSNQGSSKLF